MYKELFPYIQSRCPVIWVVTKEQARTEKTIVDIVQNLTNNNPSKKSLVASWSLTTSQNKPGWTQPRYAENNNAFVYSDFDSAHMAIQEFIHVNQTNEIKELNVAIFRSAEVLVNDPYFLSSLEEAVYKLPNTTGTIMCISSSYKVPEHIKNITTVVTLGPPDEQALMDLVDSVFQTLQDGMDSWYKNKNVQPEKIKIINGISNTKQDLVNALKGLTLSRAKDLITYSFATQKTNINIELIAQKKAESLSNIPGLKIEKKAYSLEDVGGLSNLKAWIKKRRKLFTKEAKDFGINPCKGLVSIGISGCGKSLIAKAIASEYNLPLVSLNLAEIKGGIVGETETNMRIALQHLDSLSPLVCWIDEIEKGVPNSSGQALDGGASSGMLQILLKWLQEREGDIFTVVTANDVSSIPTELLRKGRFDEIFFVDMPGSTEEIAEIINIHTRRRGREFCFKEIKDVAESLITEEGSYTGAEIEAAVNEGLLVAFNEDRELTLQDIKEAALLSVPMYKTMKENIIKLRSWCKNRAVPASNSYNFINTDKTKIPPPLMAGH